ncbi:hypothetical protein OROGR_022647 [Orobanche gracilis]
MYISSETNVDGPILPPPTDMEPEEGYALREWRTFCCDSIEGVIAERYLMEEKMDEISLDIRSMGWQKPVFFYLCSAFKGRVLKSPVYQRIYEDSYKSLLANRFKYCKDHNETLTYAQSLEFGPGPPEPIVFLSKSEQNAIRLEEKEKREKELLNQINVAAEEFMIELHRKGQLTCETNKVSNREKEKVFVASQEKFHADAGKDYWKSIAELIPNEVPTIEKRKGKKDQDEKPSTFVVQGPKPGKPTDLARMRQILLNLKHNTPPHLKPSHPVAVA